MVTVVICKNVGVPDSEYAAKPDLLVSFFYSIMCPEAATPVEMDAIESSR